MKSITQILKEIKALNEKLSADLQKKVGNVLFGDEDDIAKLQGKKIPKGSDSVEKNTAWEEDLYTRILNWTGSSDDKLAKYFKKNKTLLSTLAKEFPTVLQPPIGQIAYRGTSIKTDSLKAEFFKKQYKIIKVGGREVFRFKNLKYSPIRNSQSWTIDPKVAFKFEGNANNEDSVHVVYATKINNDFIFTPELLRIIFGGPTSEEETIRVGSEGTFEAYVDSAVFLNTWKFEPKDNFVHKLTKARPFFKPMVDNYNKLAAKDNKRFDEEMFSPVYSVEDVIEAYEADNAVSYPTGFSLNKEYAKALQQFIKSVKTK
jgi:hypothetical protein